MIKYAQNGVLTLAAALIFVTQAAAQPDSPPSEPKAAARSDTPAGERYLMDLYKISAADAKERIALQDQVSALVLTLGQTNSDSFGGIWIQHEPVYKIMIGFKDAST